MRLQLLFLLAVAATALAQNPTNTNTITVTATRNVSVPPDQVVYSVLVYTDFSAGLADATALVAEAGIKATDLLYTSSFGGTMTWSFEHAVPFSGMKDTNVTLAKLAKHTGPLTGLVLISPPSIVYSVSSVRTSETARSQACEFSALVSDARREAERLAAAAGVHVGSIVGLSKQPELDAVLVPTIVSRVGSFSAVVTGIPVSIYDPLPSFVGTSLPPQQTPCSIVVQFRLLP